MTARVPPGSKRRDPEDVALLLLRLGTGASLALLCLGWHIIVGAPLIEGHAASAVVRAGLVAGAVLVAAGAWTRPAAAALAAAAIAGGVQGLAAGEPLRIEPARDLIFALAFAAIAVAGAGRCSADRAWRHVVRAPDRRAWLLLRVGAGASLALLFGATKVGWIVSAWRTGRPWAMAVFLRQMGFPLPAFLAACATVNEAVSSTLLALGVLPRLVAALLAADMVVSFGTSVRLAEEPLRAGLYVVVFAALALASPPRHPRVERGVMAGGVAAALILLSLARMPRTVIPTAPRSAGSRAARVVDLPVDSGATLSRYCMGCHDPSASAPLGPDLAAIAARLSREQMIAAVTDGHGAMPSFGYRWTSAQIRAVVAYLRAPKRPR